MPRNRMPGHGPDNGEKSLAEKAAIALAKRWVKDKLDKGAKMNPINLPDKSMGKSLTVISIVLYLLGNLMVRVADGLSTGDWYALTEWIQSQEFWTLIAGAGVVFGLRKAQGQATVAAQHGAAMQTLAAAATVDAAAETTKAASDTTKAAEKIEDAAERIE